MKACKNTEYHNFFSNVSHNISKTSGTTKREECQ